MPPLGGADPRNDTKTKKVYVNTIAAICKLTIGIKFYTLISMKKLIFVGSTLKDLKKFPKEAQRDAGYQLDKVQKGNEPSDWKPMTSIGTGVQEIRIKESGDQYRVIYIASFADAIYVLHAFQKKAQKTPKTDLDKAKQRLKAIQNDRGKE